MGPNLPQKEYFRSKIEKVNTTIEFCIFKSLQLELTIFQFCDQICPKSVFPVESGKSERQQWILHNRISLSTKFQLELTILSFGPNFLKKGISGFSMVYFKGISMVVFTLSVLERKYSFWGKFGPKGSNLFPKEYFSSKKEKNEHDHWILRTQVSLGIPFQLKLTILNFVSKFA